MSGKNINYLVFFAVVAGIKILEEEVMMMDCFCEMLDRRQCIKVYI